jgi:hypothetical protein
MIRSSNSDSLKMTMYTHCRDVFLHSEGHFCWSFGSSRLFHFSRYVVIFRCIHQSFWWQFGNRVRIVSPAYVEMVDVPCKDMRGYQWGIRTNMKSVVVVHAYTFEYNLLMRREELDSMENVEAGRISMHEMEEKEVLDNTRILKIINKCNDSKLKMDKSGSEKLKAESLIIPEHHYVDV